MPRELKTDRVSTASRNYYWANKTLVRAKSYLKLNPDKTAQEVCRLYGLPEDTDLSKKRRRGPPSEETSRKISAANIGRLRNENNERVQVDTETSSETSSVVSNEECKEQNENETIIQVPVIENRVKTEVIVVESNKGKTISYKQYKARIAEDLDRSELWVNAYVNHRQLLLDDWILGKVELNNKYCKMNDFLKTSAHKESFFTISEDNIIITYM